MPSVEIDLDAEAEAVVWGSATAAQRQQRYVNMWRDYLALGGRLSRHETAASSADLTSTPRSARLVRRYGV